MTVATIIYPLIPAKAGTQAEGQCALGLSGLVSNLAWIPACAGTSGKGGVR